MTSLDGPPEPTTTPSQTTLDGIRAHAEAWDHLASRWGALTATEVDARMHALTGTAARLAHEGQLLAVHRDNGGVAYPGFQFTRAGTPVLAMTQILHAFTTADWDADSIALWFISPQGSADGAVPADLLHADPERVLAAARSTAAA